MLCREREQREVTCTLHGTRQTALMFGARASLPTWADLPALCQVAAQQIRIFIGHFRDLIDAEIAKLVTTWAKSATARTTSAPATSTII